MVKLFNTRVGANCCMSEYTPEIHGQLLVLQYEARALPHSVIPRFTLYARPALLVLRNWLLLNFI